MADIARIARAALPFFAKGKVVSGFQRGSKDLGCPTANFSDEVVENLPEQLACGVYCGFANVDDGQLHRMVLSIGWNPYYKNTKRTMETHILHEFSKDFYDSQLKLVITHYIRPMSDFESPEALMAAIDSDKKESYQLLNDDLYSNYCKHDFFQTK